MLVEDEWELNELMKIIEGKNEARERALNSTSKANRGLSREVPTATTLVSSDSNTTKVFLLSPVTLFQLLSDGNRCSGTKTDIKGRCFVCLKKFHMSRECWSSLRCTICSGRHHVSICPGTSHQSQTPVNNSSNTTSMYCGSTKVPVLLQTARAHVFKIGFPKATREVRIIFDSGSQRSYVTDNVRKLLNLESKSTETMIIKTFGSTKTNRQACDVVAVGMLLKNGGKLELSFLTVPLICEPLQYHVSVRTTNTYPN